MVGMIEVVLVVDVVDAVPDGAAPMSPSYTPTSTTATLIAGGQTTNLLNAITWVPGTTVPLPYGNAWVVWKKMVTVFQRASDSCQWLEDT